MFGCAKNILATSARLLLCASLLLFTAGVPAAVLANGTVDGAQADVNSEPMVSKIKLKAYPVNNDDSSTWDVSEKEDNSTTKISENGGRLRICVTAVLGDGTSIPEYLSDNWAEVKGVDEGFEYTWDGDCVTVGPTGVITALKDGKTKITVTPKNEELKNLSASIEIETFNQGEGFIVSKVQIVNENGKAYGDGAITLTDSAATAKAYCKITYTDKQTKATKVVSNYPSAPKDEQPTGDELNNVTWSLSDNQYADLSTGSDSIASLKGIAVGVIELRCAVSGGDASESMGMGNGVVFDAVTVKIANGKTINGGTPADKLTVNVVYEKDLDTVAVSKTYTKKQFEKLGAVTRSYTLTRSAGRYATDKAYGVPIATLLKALNIDVDDIRYFTLKANDGANPGKISAKWLLKTTRYYFPNYDLGGSKAGAKQVPSMLALEDSWSDNSTETGEMNSGTCFRLLFGSAGSSDDSTDKSIKFVNTFTIVLSGAAPSQHGKSKQKAEKKAKTSASGGTGKGAGNSQGDGVGNSSGDGSGKGESEGDSGGGSQGNAENSTSVGDADNSSSKQTAQPLTNEAAWSIRQMMNKNNSAVSVVYEDPNLIPAAIAVSLAVFLGAGLIRYLLFRRRLK